MVSDLFNAEAKFSLGRTIITRGALAALSETDIKIALRRHVSGDWGDLDPPDKARNEDALKTEGRLFSRYQSKVGTKFYVITEWDRSYTTVLLLSEY
jgi:hypothetical protein